MLHRQTCNPVGRQSYAVRNLPSCSVRPARLRSVTPCVVQQWAEQHSGQRVVFARSSVPSRPASVEPYQSIDVTDMYDADLDACPHGSVANVMLKADAGVLTAKPSDKLQDIIPKLNKVSGLPVLNADGQVVGVISRKDIIRVRRTAGSLKDKVEQHMTKPAVTVTAGTSVRDAAKLMLNQKVRRLPVVDEEQRPLGILSRSNIFKPLQDEQYEKLVQREVAAMATGAGVKPTWEIKYLYDGDCAMCRSLKAVLERQDGRRGRIAFIDIADLDYDPLDNMGIEYDEAMDTIHAIRKDGQVLLGTDALRALFDMVGLGWAVQLSEVPLFSKLLELVYSFLSSNRIALGGVIDGLIAAKRLEMSKQGVETCGDVDEECEIEWMGDEEGNEELASKH